MDMGLATGDAVVLDETDKKVIHQLQLNCRQSIATIAKKTHLARDVVKYRIKKLENQSVIRSYHAFVNPAKIGYPMYVFVLFSLTDFTPEAEKKFRAYLVGHEHVIYVAKVSGKWDYSIMVCAKDFKEFDSVMYDIRTQFSSIIRDFDTGSIIDEYKYDFLADLIKPKK